MKKKKIFDVIEAADNFEEDETFSGEDYGTEHFPAAGGQIIDFYGRKPVSDEEFALMSDGEKREELVVRYRPLCINAAKAYGYCGADFADMFMEAVVLILEVIDRWGVDDPDIAYHVASRVKSGLQRAGEKERKICASFLTFDDGYDDEIAGWEETADEAELTQRIRDDMERCLDGGELETAKLYFDCPDISQQEAAELLGVSQQTVSKWLDAARRKLAPLKKEYAVKSGIKRRKNFIAACKAGKKGR